MQHWNRWIRCVDPLFALDSQHISSRGQRDVNRWLSRLRLHQNTVLLQLDFALMATDRAANECGPGILDVKGKNMAELFLSPWTGSETGSDPIITAVLKLFLFLYMHWGVCTSYRPLWFKPDTISSDNHDSELCLSSPHAGPVTFWF